jgi:site-specific DNA-methyltransferase (adenine-specific)
MIAEREHGTGGDYVDRLVREFLDLRRMDCMKLMAGYPDKHFDLAIVDPPYGMERKMDGSGGAGRVMRRWKRAESWDVAPNQEYFAELFRVSKNQIVWGANNFWEHLRKTTNFVFWHKHQPAPNFADGELAWTSFTKVCRCLDLPCFGAHGQDDNGKIHPTQKPVKLYSWLLANYAEPGQTILDTHMGSGSIAIACHYARLHLTASEIDEDYFKAACSRIERETAQESFCFPNAKDHRCSPEASDTTQKGK